MLLHSRRDYRPARARESPQIPRVSSPGNDKTSSRRARQDSLVVTSLARILSSSLRVFSSPKEYARARTHIRSAPSAAPREIQFSARLRAPARFVRGRAPQPPHKRARARALSSSNNARRHTLNKQAVSPCAEGKQTRRERSRSSFCVWFARLSFSRERASARASLYMRQTGNHQDHRAIYQGASREWVQVTPHLRPEECRARCISPRGARQVAAELPI